MISKLKMRMPQIFVFMLLAGCLQQSNVVNSDLSAADTSIPGLDHLVDSLSAEVRPDNEPRRRIDSIVNEIEKDSTLSTTNFSIVALKKVGHILTYEYRSRGDRVHKIRRQFSYKQDTVIQVFYLKNDQLVYASETILSFFTENNRTDTIPWAGSFYFDKGKMIDYVTLGHGKSEEDWWKPETAMLGPFNDSRRDIQRYLKSRK